MSDETASACLMPRRRPDHASAAVAVSAKPGGFTPPAAGTGVVGTIGLDAPFATTGPCGEELLGSYRPSKSAKTLVCS